VTFQQTPQRNRGEVWLDVSRMLYRIFCGRITGIDRVEIAYAEQLAQGRAPARFVAYDYWRGTFRMLPQEKTRALILDFAPAWRAGEMCEMRRRAFRALAGSLFTAPRVPRWRGGARPVYVNVSAHPLHLVERIGRMLERTGAIFVPLVHDLIPLELPEYVPPAWVAHHRRRLRTIAGYADGIISNSGSTTAALREHIPHLPIATIPLGTLPFTPKSGPTHPHPYFVMVGTIEPRKNHLMLLHLWRSMVQELGVAAPHLFIIGRRGWENEQIVDLLERSETIRNHVFETGMIADDDMARHVAGAQSLLMPSFAEGYGLPVVEALSLGVPVLCSDIAAHREIGKGVPEYLDPLDGMGWRQMILEYARPGSTRRAAQCARLQGWAAPDWQSHVAAVLEFAARIEPCRQLSQSSWSRTTLETSITNIQVMNPASAVSTITSQRIG
jgi:glycosyltransferase involved in cell wall biosynthesis